jgi:hypothetical protein
MNVDKSVAGRIGLRRLADWIRRSCDAMLADLELADCGSLDVLTYCAEDLVMTGRGDLEIDRLSR